jgi:hypothetical protein
MQLISFDSAAKEKIISDYILDTGTVFKKQDHKNDHV